MKKNVFIYSFCFVNTGKRISNIFFIFGLRHERVKEDVQILKIIIYNNKNNNKKPLGTFENFQN